MPPSKLTQVANHVIALAKAYDIARRKVEGTGFEPDGSISLSFPPGWDEPKPPLPEREQLEEYLASQSADVVYALLALTYFAQGSIRSANTLRDVRDQMRRDLKTPTDAIRQMMGKPLVRRLETALQKVSKFGIDLDATLLTTGPHGS
jgi:hypothetical protein